MDCTKCIQGTFLFHTDQFGSFNQCANCGVIIDLTVDPHAENFTRPLSTLGCDYILVPLSRRSPTMHDLLYTMPDMFTTGTRTRKGNIA